MHFAEGIDGDLRGALDIGVVAYIAHHAAHLGQVEAARVYRAHGRHCRMAVRRDSAANGANLSPWRLVRRSTKFSAFRRDDR
jgi:hypothetical protein